MNSVRELSVLKPILVTLTMLIGSTSAHAYTASKVWFEFRPTGTFRVYVTYTVPELKEVREAYVDFMQKQEAEKFYWDLVRGADFYPPDPKAAKFINSPLKPDPW